MYAKANERKERHLNMSFFNVMDALAEFFKQDIDRNPFMTDPEKLCRKLMIDWAKETGKRNYLRNQYYYFGQ